MKSETCLRLISLSLRHLAKNSLDEVILSSMLTAQGELPVKRNEEPELITEADLKRKLTMSSTTLWRHRRKGLPYMKKGKKIYYEYSKVIKFIGGLRNA